MAVLAWTDRIAHGVFDFVRQCPGNPFDVQLEAPELLDSLNWWKGDGLIAPVEDPRHAQTIRELGLRAVNISGKNADVGLPSVLVDDLAAGRLAADHLLDHGFRRFGYLGLGGFAYATLRGQGFIDALRQARCACDSLVLPEYWSRNRGAEKARKMLTDWLAGLPKPAGVLACNDSQARWIVEVCLDRGIRIPDELGLVGVDNLECHCRTLAITLSSVDTDLRKVGYEAGALMYRLLAGETPPPKPVRVPPRGVEPRQSTDVMAARDPLVLRSIRFIRRNARDPINVADVVRAVSVSRRVLERRFRRTAGRSPHEELLRTRVEMAKAALLQTDWTMEAIAESCGFTYAARMFAAFRQATGMTPGQYRRRFGREAEKDFVKT